MADVGPRQRASILRYASHQLPLDDRADPALVITAARPLLEFAGQASDDEDLEVRMAAMGRQDQNTTRPESPEEFTSQARILYAFLTGGA